MCTTFASKPCGAIEEVFSVELMIATAWTSNMIKSMISICGGWHICSSDQGLHNFENWCRCIGMGNYSNSILCEVVFQFCFNCLFFYEIPLFSVTLPIFPLKITFLLFFGSFSRPDLGLDWRGTGISKPAGRWQDIWAGPRFPVVHRISNYEAHLTS